MNTIEFFAIGIPKGQPRPKAFNRGKHAAVYTPGTAEHWKSDVARSWQQIGSPICPDVPLKITLVFHFPRPKSHFNSKGEVKPTAPIYHTSTPDADNAAKAVLDALTHLSTWRDDSIVCVMNVSKLYGSPAGCFIRIEDAPATIEQCQIACQTMSLTLQDGQSSSPK